MDNQVPVEVSTARLYRLQALITRHQRTFNDSFVGRTVEVLLEKPGKLPGQLVGKTPYLQTVQVMAPRTLIGSELPATVTGTGTNTLFGNLAQPARAPAFATAGA
jgi:tRNA-2-methylthio-N6-dimethylallyladenosine synthase